MKYNKSKKYEKYINRIMGPNPIKLEEELMQYNKTPKGSVVMDLGSGQGITSIFLAKEYGFQVYAADLWSDPVEIKNFFEEEGIKEKEVIPVHADALNLPFEKEFFDAVISIDSYNYFGRDKDFLDNKLLPFLKPEGYVYFAVPGMKKDCHNNIPPELLLSWTAEELDYIHDAEYWKKILSRSKNSQIISVFEMESNEECWNDWLKCDNEYAKNDRKSMEAGGGKYLNFVAAVLRKK